MIVPMGFDAETSSAVDLRKCGSYAYFADPDTRVLMGCFRPNGSDQAPALWLEGEPPPAAWVEHVAARGEVSGWNVLGFDRIGYATKMVVKHGFPPINDDLWRDSMHLAAAMNLPRSLDGAAKAIGVAHNSDLKDSNRIRRITDAKRTPIPATVAEILWNPDRYEHVKTTGSTTIVDDLRWLAARCIQDVIMEDEVLRRLQPWPSVHPWLAMPAIDRKINDRGVMIDVELVRGLAHAAAVETKRLDGEMNRLTNGQVISTTRIESLKDWLVGRGVPVPLKTQKAVETEENGEDDDDEPDEKPEAVYRLRKNDIANLLSMPGIDQDCRTAMFYRADAAKASTRKLQAMLNVVNSDGRMQGLLLLLGAQATWRWSSGRVQVHNLVRDSFAKDYENIAEQNGLDSKKDKAAVRRLAQMALRTAIEVGRTGDSEFIRSMYQTERKDLQGRKRMEGVLPWISRMMRRTVCAPAGKVLLNGDYANIEARIPVWLAGQQDMVDAFARGEDVYRKQAAPVYGKAPEDLSSEERQIGKVMRLFLGFCGGVNAFIPAALNYGLTIPREDGQRYVTIFRDTNKQLMDYCDRNLACAVLAVQYPGQTYEVAPTNLVSWTMQGDCLYCRLPSGRFLRYWQPRLKQGYWDDGTPKSKLDLTVLVVKGRAVLRRTLWRGLSIENITQAIAADMLACALANANEANIPIMLHVHDNLCPEVNEDDAETILPVFKQCMLAMPNWTRGLPVAVDVDISTRFG